jgi:hypothetical protein
VPLEFVEYLTQRRKDRRVVVSKLFFFINIRFNLNEIREIMEKMSNNNFASLRLCVIKFC